MENHHAKKMPRRSVTDGALINNPVWGTRVTIRSGRKTNGNVLADVQVIRVHLLLEVPASQFFLHYGVVMMETNTEQMNANSVRAS